MKSSAQSTNAMGIQIASEATAEVEGYNHSCSPKMLAGSKEREQSLVGNCIYISHSSCSSADGCSRPGGNCIYISHSSCSSAD